MKKTNWGIIFIVFLLASAVGVNLWLEIKREVPGVPLFELGYSQKEPNEKSQNIKERAETAECCDNAQQFRDECIKLIRSYIQDPLDGGIKDKMSSLDIEGSWDIIIALYRGGAKIAETEQKGRILSAVLKKASAEVISSVSSEDIKNARVLVRMLYPEGSFDFIEHQGEGRELIGGLTVIRELNKAVIEEKLKEGSDFLLRMAEPEEKGFYKRYDAPTDSFEERLHTVYSASIIYTFLKTDDYQTRGYIQDKISDWGNFLLSMQSLEGESKGAFYYSYYYREREKEERFVVGTAALSIFTLLDLYEKTREIKYLDSSKLAADWLLGMQRKDGVIRPYLENNHGEWIWGDQESLLYNGQVLSALSKIYNVVGEEKYLKAAEKIADHFTSLVAEGGCFLGDEYRSQNPISSAWVVMSLMDFYKITPRLEHKSIILNCGLDLTKRQMNDIQDPLFSGRWAMAFSTSGNGWLAEVMTELYHFCISKGGNNCEPYKEAVVRVVRWLIQHTYSEINSFALPNPELAQGGLFWDYNNKYIRTDSVCHGLNAYAGIFRDLEEGIIISLPEKSFEKTIDSFIL